MKLFNNLVKNTKQETNPEENSTQPSSPETNLQATSTVKSPTPIPTLIQQ